MPCSDGGDYQAYEIESLRTQVSTLTQRNDELAQNLCTLLSFLQHSDEQYYQDVMLNNENLRIWHNHHKQLDAAKKIQAQSLKQKIKDTEQELKNMKAQYEKLK